MWKTKMAAGWTSVPDVLKPNKRNGGWIPYGAREFPEKQNKSNLWVEIACCIPGNFDMEFSTPRRVLIKMLTSRINFVQAFGQKKQSAYKKKYQAGLQLPTVIINAWEQWKNAHEAFSEGKKTWLKNMTPTQNVIQGWKTPADIHKQERIQGLKHSQTLLENTPG